MGTGIGPQNLGEPGGKAGHTPCGCRKPEVSVLLASHNMDEVKRLCDSVLMMKDGIIVDDGTPDHLITKHGRKNLVVLNY